MSDDNHGFCGWRTDSGLWCLKPKDHLRQERESGSASYGCEFVSPLAEIARLTTEIAALKAAAEAASAERTVLATQLAERVIAPDRCPLTGRRFFMVVDGLATYGGPHDSYTIPERDEDGAFFCRHYDHDRGGWSEEDEYPALVVVATENLLAMTERAEAAEKRAEAAERLVSDLRECLGTAHARAGSYEARLAALEAAAREAPLTFRRLQDEQRPWVAHNFEGRHDYYPLLGAQEELGELAHAHLKGLQGIRHTPEEIRAKKEDAVADVVIFLSDYCSASGIDFQAAVEKTWAEVRKRDWKADPKNASPPAEPAPDHTCATGGGECLHPGHHPAELKPCATCGGRK